MKTIAEVEAHLASHAPWVDPSPARVEAGVAAVLREQEEGLELLFIRRAEYENDPWSGDLAFPGGRVDPEDAGPREAAVRETLEEVALDLRGARILGRLSDVLGSAESIRVSAFVFAIEGDPKLEPNYEVREAFWSPLAHCCDPRRQQWRDFTYRGAISRLPTIRLLDDERAPVLWGITYKLLDHLMKAIGHPIPYMPWEEGGPE
jgi:8-oxo-dGTP pyrophosphatase MutT (NUDIX family)